ncbi:PH domain-containing protein [Nonomuraea sp. NPDC048826]|uniref:PH domain-containing protein n=1 Tax=Nonomuraea sp. NPDC048826 TaxID=3364347 RepID=UPI0037185848
MLSEQRVTSDGWRRLDARTLWAATLWCAGFVLVTFAILWWRDASWWLFAVTPVPALPAIGYEALRWSKTRYRLTPAHLELRTGVFLRRHRSIPRERVRTVDVLADPVQRILRLATFRVGTGHRVRSAKAAVLSLNALSRADAEALRAALVLRAEPEEQQAIARIDWRWLRFGPLTFATPLLGLGAVGITYEILDALGYDPDNVAIPRLITWLGGVDLLPVLALTALALLVAGMIGALVRYAETWWDFRLVREPHGGLRATRGLLVTRSATLEEERLHGVEIAEPLTLRSGGGAYTFAVVTGAGGAEEEASTFNTSALLPPAPIEQAHRVAATVLREEESPARAVRLLPHPRAALARRVRWAFGCAGVLGAVQAAVGAWLTPVLTHLWWVTALAACAAGLLFARDGYRNLGHGITGGYLVTRHGSLKRRTIALRRGGVIGWTITQWAWHRRSTLCRVTATTPGGRGAYHVKDVSMGEGLRFADEAVPGLLAPFLVRREGGVSRGAGPGTSAGRRRPSRRAGAGPTGPR